MTYQGTITSKGQTTVPKEIRDKLNLKSGDRVYWIMEEGQAVLKPKTGSILDLAGMLHRPGQKAATIEEMNTAIAEAAAEGAMGHMRRRK